MPSRSSAPTVANWSANLLVSVTFLSLINAVGKPWTFWIYRRRQR
jgi:MFS transporter, SP family, galactose:H+ symporter